MCVCVGLRVRVLFISRFTPSTLLLCKGCVDLMLLLRFYFVLFEEVCVYISRIVQNMKMK